MNCPPNFKSLSNDEIDELIEEAVNSRQNKKSLIGVFIKPDEKGYKRRLIANVPLGGYIIASYIRYLIESFTGPNPLFTKLSPTSDEIINVADILKNHRLALPLDESAYDYNVTRESWLGFLSFLDDTFINNTGVRYFKKYFQHAYWEFEGDKGKWIAGMPSGLALTSFLNSWMNYIKQGTIVPGIINWAAGDDVLTFPYNENVSLNEISLGIQTLERLLIQSKIGRVTDTLNISKGFTQPTVPVVTQLVFGLH